MSRKMVSGLLLLCMAMAMVMGGWVSGRGASAAERGRLVRADLIRVHMIANSDSEADQALKLRVRDAVQAELAPRLTGLATVAEAEAATIASLTDLEQAANRVIERMGFGYNARAEYGQFTFPGKSYGELYLPGGEYKALRIVLGEGRGANIWCILFPSFCYDIPEMQEPPPGGGGGNDGPGGGGGDGPGGGGADNRG